ncbi:MAG: T9SS type A sorting domain-containing protein [Cyclobacteriaceae bacterium]|nr:T9SS type A sorting domain-containing protein [Cyclobacteriaceae bacterium]
MKRLILFCSILFLLLAGVQLWAQNYTSINSGAWTTASNWNNTSGWGPSTPPLTYTSGTINVNHNMTISSAANFGGTGFNVATGVTLTSNANFTFSNGTSNVNGTINVNGNFSVTNGTTNIYGTVTTTGNLSVSGGAIVNVYGTLYITGNATINANLRIFPGGKVVVEGNVTVQNSNYLTIGTSAAPPPYSDMVIYGNLIQQSSGDVTINRNGRLAVFGNVTDSGGGGTFMQINNGGQVYVHGNITYSGGGSFVQNNNTTNPYGLYVNGTASSTGGGGSITSNIGNQSTMFSTNPSFASWVASQPNSPLPVTLLSFSLKRTDNGSVLVMWSTASETDFDYFEVERSHNGADFISVGRIQGAGYNTNKVQHYSFTDTDPFIGTSYYRLKAVDLDGSSEYFQILSIVVTGSKSFHVYPNPSDGEQVNVAINFEPMAGDRLIVRDATGQVVVQQQINAQIHNLVFAEKLRPGIYLITYQSKGFSHTERLVVR